MSSDNDTQRRDLLKLIGVSSSFALAGCSGENGSQELGERVPTLVLVYWTGLGGITSFYENAAPAIKDSLERIGIEVELKPTDFGTAIDNQYQDQRTMDIVGGALSSVPGRLDPQQMLRWWVADWAGAKGKPNNSHYVSCDYSVPAMVQSSATDLEERQELVNEAEKVFSEDTVIAPMVPSEIFGAHRIDTMDADGLGDGGVNLLNPVAFLESTPTDGDTLITSSTPEMVESRNHLVSIATDTVQFWGRMVYSPLVEYDQNYELVNALAESFEISNEGETVTATLKDATFHNGDPVTAEDVAFTFEYLSQGADVFPKAVEPPYDSIEAVDEKTVQFNLERSFPSLITKTWSQWGILPKDVWVEQGARENPENFVPDTIIGSGPYQVSNFEQGSGLSLTPHDGHPVHSPDHDIQIVAFRGQQAAGQALKENEVHIASELPVGAVADLDENYSDTVNTVVRRSFLPMALYFQYPKVPTKFKPFRKALAKALNRQKVNQLAYRGKSTEAYGTSKFLKNHPWRAPEDMVYKPTEEPTGDVEDARSTLEDTGWGWDDDDNLHFPADADLNPRWPKGEVPDYDEYPCLDSDGNMVL